MIPQPHKEIPDTVDKVVGWKAFLSNTESVTFQIWRRVGPDSYRLIGQTLYLPTNTGISQINLEDDETFHVQGGEVLGIYFPGNCNIPFKTLLNGCPPDQHIRFLRSPGESVPGRNLSVVSHQACRKYAVQAILSLKGTGVYFDVIILLFHL